MNPKNTRKNAPKATPKKKVKSNAKPNAQANENKTIFYKAKSSSVNEPPKVIDEKKIIAEEPKKPERSIYLTRTLSKIYSKLSGSKENLDKAKDVENVAPFKLHRSLTLNSIQLKRQLPRLEKLSEEKIGESPPPLSPSVTIRSKSPTTYRQSMPPGSFDSVDFLKLPTQLERSGSFISLIRRKISFNETKPSPMSSSWAKSLQNLQQIDTMVSYEDLSFVDYDKLNHYEQQINKMLERLQRKTLTPAAPVQTMNAVVVRRQPKKSSSRSTMGDFYSNLDREKNLYRQSIDSNKLRFLSSINLDSHRWSQANDNPIDWLSLENTPHALNSISYGIFNA